MPTRPNHLPDLNRLNQRLALNAVRVQEFLEGLSPRLDALLEAARLRNWSEVGRLSHVVLRCCDVYGYKALAQKAAQVCEANAACEAPEIIAKKVIGLMGEFARTSSRSLAASSLA